MITLLCIANRFLPGHRKTIHPFSPWGPQAPPALENIQSCQITSKMAPIERAQKNKHFLCKNLGLEINIFPDISITSKKQ